MYFLYNYVWSPEIPPGSTKFDIVEVTNENKLVMSFLEKDFSINQYMHSLPNVPESVGALEAIRNATVIWVGVDPEPHPLMAVDSNEVVYISCDNVTPYSDTDGRIYTVWYGPLFEASDTRMWLRNVNALTLHDYPPIVFHGAAAHLRARYYRPGQLDPANLGESRMGIIVNDDIQLSFSNMEGDEEKRTLSAEILRDKADMMAASKMAIGVMYPTYGDLLLALDVVYTSYDNNRIFVVHDATDAPHVVDGTAVFMYDHQASLTAGQPVLIVVYNAANMDNIMSLDAVMNGPMKNGMKLTTADYDSLVDDAHSHDPAHMVIAEQMSLAPNGNLVFNNVELAEGFAIDVNMW